MFLLRLSIFNSSFSRQGGSQKEEFLNYIPGTIEYRVRKVEEEKAYLQQRLSSIVPECPVIKIRSGNNLIKLFQGLLGEVQEGYPYLPLSARSLFLW